MSVTQEQWKMINAVNYDIIYKIYEWLCEDTMEIETVDDFPMASMNTPPSTPVSCSLDF